MHPSHTFTSVETSPEYADPARLDLLKQAGVARVSIGVQSFLDEELTAVSYTHLDVYKRQLLGYINTGTSASSSVCLYRER